MAVQAETRLQNEIRLALSSRCNQVTTWRNHTGCLQDGDGKWIKFGLCPGSSDLIGIRKLKITQDMVGQEIGQFVALEIKTDTGKARPDQYTFLDHVNERGGLGAIVRSTDEAVELLS